MKIEDFIFSKMNKENKLKHINELADSEILAICTSTVKRIIQEVGYKGQFYLLKNIYTGNIGVSCIYYPFKSRKDTEVRVCFDIMGLDTDRSCSCLFKDFMCKDIIGSFTERYGNGYQQLIQGRVDNNSRKEVIKAILENYIHCKYDTK